MIPKYDLHRHLGGSLQPEFVYALAMKHGVDIELKTIRKSMTFQNGEKRDFYGFLKKFDILNNIPWDDADIIDMAHHVVAELIREDISHCEIKLSVKKYLKYTKMSDVELIRFIKEAFDDATNNTNVNVELMLSVKYESTDNELATARRVEKYADCMAAIDLVGDENKFDINRFKPIMDIWRLYGLGIMAHAGESQPAKNVELAVKELGATRIAHGIRVPNENMDLLNFCKDRNICFDVAITSNLLTGVVKDIRDHPALKMIRNGNIVTIGTDDPAVCRTTLEKEFRIIRDNWNLSDEEIDKLKLNAIARAFRNPI